MTAKFTRYLAAAIAAAALSGAAAAQDTRAFDTAAADPSAVCLGTALPARSAIVPYPTHEEALAATGTSQYVLPVMEWSRETTAGATRYTGRFKTRYTLDGRAFILRVEDVASSFSVGVNGTETGYSQAGAGRHEFDITELIIPDYNTVTVTIYDPAAAGTISRGNASRESGFGSAAVISQPPVRLHDVMLSSRIDDGTGYMHVGVVTRSILLNPKTYSIRIELADGRGTTVATAQRELTTGMLSCDTLPVTLQVDHARAWTHESPELYTLLIESRYMNRPVEYVALRTGFRANGFENGNLTIGGTPVRVASTDHTANPDPGIERERLARLKAAGYNCLIVDGRPQPDHFYSLCDEMGLYVCDAAAIDAAGTPAERTAGGTPSNDPLWRDAYVDRAMTACLGARLHPCVVMLTPARRASNGFCLYEAYSALREAAPDLAVFYPEAGGEWNNDICTASLRNAPEPVPAVPVTASMAGGAVTLRNRFSLTKVNGTYKITVRDGARKRTIAGEFSLDGGASTEVPVPAPARRDRATVTVEITVPRRIPSSGETPAAEDASETSTETFAYGAAE